MTLKQLKELLANVPDHYQIVLSQFITDPIDWTTLSDSDKNIYKGYGLTEGKDKYLYIVRDFPTTGMAVNHEGKEVRIALSVSDMKAIMAVHPNNFKLFKNNNPHNPNRRNKHRNNNPRKNA